MVQLAVVSQVVVVVFVLDELVAAAGAVPVGRPRRALALNHHRGLEAARAGRRRATHCGERRRLVLLRGLPKALGRRQLHAQFCL